MRYARPILSAVIFPTAFAAFGLHAWGGDWLGAVVGAGLGLIFAGVFGLPLDRRR